MAKQQRQATGRSGPPPEALDRPVPEAGREGKKRMEDLDRLLHEIDAVLQENAEAFVENYVQKGGQ